jgi:hypothetical protein
MPLPSQPLRSRCRELRLWPRSAHSSIRRRRDGAHVGNGWPDFYYTGNGHWKDVPRAIPAANRYCPMASDCRMGSRRLPLLRLLLDGHPVLVSGKQ